MIMPTNNQLTSNVRKLKKFKKINKALEKCPYKRGVCVKVLIKTPKKPNSAQRKVVKVKLSTGRIIFSHIPGEGHNLQEHSVVLIRGGRIPDLPGINYRLVNGIYDLNRLYDRRQKRSKYGSKCPILSRPWKLKQKIRFKAMHRKKKKELKLLLKNVI